MREVREVLAPDGVWVIVDITSEGLDAVEVRRLQEPKTEHPSISEFASSVLVEILTNPGILELKPTGFRGVGGLQFSHDGFRITG